MSTEENQDALEWATSRLDEFIAASAIKREPVGALGSRYTTIAANDEVVLHWAIVEKVLHRYLPDWLDRVQDKDALKAKRGYRWQQRREAAQLCRTLLEHEQAIQTYLTDWSPVLAASSLHEWIWDAAKSAWEAGNYEDAVDAASRNLNSRLRAKVGRKDIGEGDLIAQVFSDKPADETTPRLRLPLAAGLNDKTVANIHGGVIAYGRGLFQAVRNPLAHEATADVEMGEAEALECLAALSLLARWVDRATVHRS